MFDELRKGVSAVMTNRFPEIRPDWIEDFSSLSTTSQPENFDLYEVLNRSTKAISENSGVEVALQPPIASLNGSLAIVYSISRSSLNETAPSGTTEEIPFYLSKVGFTTNNLLIWELDFGTSAVDVRQLESFGSAINILDNLSEQVINASHAKIVILSGLHPQRFLSNHLSQRSGRISAPLDLHLESLSMTFYVEMCDNNVRRIFMNAPELTNVSNAK